MAKIYKWGIIGPGKIANKFAAALQLTDRGELAAIASRNPERAKAFADKYDCPTFYTDYLDLIKDPAIDAIYIATPHAFHLEQVSLCLENKKAVLCEKPLTLSANQTKTLLKLAEKQQTFLMEAMWARFTPLTQKILDIIASGTVGEIRYIKADFGFPAPYNPDGRLFDPNLGGGSLLDVGIYPLFLTTLLLGQPEKITARGNISEQGIDLDCHAILEYKNAKSAVISSSISYQMPITAEIAGTKGQIRIPCPWYKNDWFELSTKQNIWEKIELPVMENGFEYEINEVAFCLDNGKVQSAAWPVTTSHQVASMMDEIKNQIGVKYPTE